MSCVPRTLASVQGKRRLAMLTPELPGFALLESAVMKLAGVRTIIDIGTPMRRHKEMAALHTSLDQDRYFAMGYRSARSTAIDLRGDVLSLPILTGSVGGIICLEVLEHVEDPWLAVEEMRRTLRPAGRLVLTVPFLRGWHGKADAMAADHYDDYWRFTHQGLGKIFHHFQEVRVQVLSGRWADRVERINNRHLRRLLANIFAGTFAREDKNLADARRFIVEASK